MILNLSQVTFDKQQISNHLLVLLGFFLTVSVFISDILIFGIILIWLLNRSWSKKFQLIKSNNFAVSVILFFCFYLIGLIWGELNSDSWKWISKQALLLSIPIIISFPFKKETINKSLLAFLFGMCLNSIISIYLLNGETVVSTYSGKFLRLDTFRETQGIVNSLLEFR